MKKNPLSFNEIVIGSSVKTVSDKISRMVKEGRLVKIAPRIYTSNLNDTPDHIIRRNIFYILGKLYPKAVISHRTAFECRPTADGHIFLTYIYTRNVKLPGLTVHLQQGPGGMSQDSPFIEGLYVSSEARAFLENLQSSRLRGGICKSLNQTELEERLEKKIVAGGEDALNDLRDKAKALASELGMEAEYEKLNKIIGAILSTKPSKILTSQLAMARALGEPYDSERLSLFETLFAQLRNGEFAVMEELNVTEKAYRNFAFFESYFSNYIEGTEFEIDEARRIVETETPMPARNADSHDVLGTFYIVNNRKEMSVIPSSPTELYEILQRRHTIMMSARPDSNPGEFKTMNNRAGDTHFVDYRLVRGTLLKGYEIYQTLTHPFARAIFMLFMISEVHPFADGNGRISRIMMNAELTHAAQSKLIIPTVFREDYLGALRRLTRRSDPTVLIRAMQRLQKFSHSIYGEDYERMKTYLELTNAFKDGDGYILTF